LIEGEPAAVIAAPRTVRRAGHNDSRVSLSVGLPALRRVQTFV